MTRRLRDQTDPEVNALQPSSLPSAPHSHVLLLSSPAHPHLSAARVFALVFSARHSSPLCPKGNLLFIALCEGMQGRKEEGKTMVSTATGLKQPTGSRRFSRLVLSLGACFREERCLFPRLTRTLQPSLRTNQGETLAPGLQQCH